MIFEYDIGSNEEIANSDDLPDLQWMPCLRIFWAADWTAMQNVARKDFIPLSLQLIESLYKPCDPLTRISRQHIIIRGQPTRR